MPFAQEKMGFSQPPRLFLRQDKQNAANPMGKTGFYDPEKESITLYVTGRHPKDIMRSLAHELQHHTQKCNGEFESVQNMGEEGYAQSNPHMRTMEIQAYQASIVFRDWEDSCKGTIYYEHLQKGDKSSMSTKNWKNGELKSLLAESWGFNMDLSKLNEKTDKDDGLTGVKGDDDDDTSYGHFKKKKLEEEELEERGDREYRDRVAGREPGRRMKPLEEDEELEERKKGGKDWHATGKKKNQKGAKDKDTDYSGKGMRKGDKSDTDPGREDDTWRKGKKSKTHKGLNKENLMREDSGEEEGHHYDDNRMSDDDHIKAIEHHLEALKKDRDYDDDHIDEKKDLSEAQVRAIIRKALREVAKSKGK